MGDLLTMLEVVQAGGLIGLLLIIVFGGSRGWWVYGSHYRKEVEDHARTRQQLERWQDVALRALDATEAIVGRRDGR